MVNSHNSNYFPGGTGLVSATGDLVTVSPSSALSGNVLTLPSGGSGGTSGTFNGAIDNATFTVPGGISRGFNGYATGTYKLTNFGTGANRTGASNYDDYPGWARMVNQILADASQCSEQQYGYHAIIELEPHRHDWISGDPVLIVPDNGSGSSSLPVMLNVTVRYHGSSHFMYGPRGFLLQGYTSASAMRFQGTAYFTCVNPNGSTAYAIAKSSTTGNSHDAFLASGGGVGHINFECDEIFTNDSQGGTSNNAGQFVAGVDIGSCILARIYRPNTQGNGAIPSSGNGSLQAGSACMIFRGFSIQIAVDSPVCNYKDSCIDCRGYIESLYLTHFGCSLVNRGISMLPNRCDWTAFYSGDGGGSRIFVLIMDVMAECDANIAVLHLIRCANVHIYGGYLWIHAEEGGQYNGQAGNAGDVTGNGCIVMAGCTTCIIGPHELMGPAKDSGAANSTPFTGELCKAILLTQSIYSGLTGTNAPPNSTAPCAAIDIAGQHIRGFSTNGSSAHAPIYCDHTVNKLTTRDSRWYPPPYLDGYVQGSPVYDPNSLNYHRNYSGTSTFMQVIKVDQNGNQAS